MFGGITEWRSQNAFSYKFIIWIICTTDTLLILKVQTNVRTFLYWNKKKKGFSSNEKTFEIAFQSHTISKKSRIPIVLHRLRTRVCIILMSERKFSLEQFLHVRKFRKKKKNILCVMWIPTRLKVITNKYFLIECIEYIAFASYIFISRDFTPYIDGRWPCCIAKWRNDTPRQSIMSTMCYNTYGCCNYSDVLRITHLYMLLGLADGSDIRKYGVLVSARYLNNI